MVRPLPCCRRVNGWSTVKPAAIDDLKYKWWFASCKYASRLDWKPCWSLKNIPLTQRQFLMQHNFLSLQVVVVLSVSFALWMVMVFSMLDEWLGDRFWNYQRQNVPMIKYFIISNSRPNLIKVSKAQSKKREHSLHACEFIQIFSSSCLKDKHFPLLPPCILISSWDKGKL